MELYEYSDPAFVSGKAHELGLGDVHPSSRKDKKYMIYDPYVGRMVHLDLHYMKTTRNTRTSTDDKIF